MGKILRTPGEVMSHTVSWKFEGAVSVASVFLFTSGDDKLNCSK